MLQEWLHLSLMILDFSLELDSIFIRINPCSSRKIGKNNVTFAYYLLMYVVPIHDFITVLLPLSGRDGKYYSHILQLRILRVKMFNWMICPRLHFIT